MKGNIQHWHGRNIRIVSSVENCFHIFLQCFLWMIKAIAISLPQKFGMFSLRYSCVFFAIWQGAASCVFGWESFPHCLQCFCGWTRQLRFPYLRSWASSPCGTPVFSLPYDRVLHLADAHNLHHKFFFIHGSSCFDIDIRTDPFIWVLFATGCHNP